MSYDNFATTFSNSRKNLSWPELDYIIEDMKRHTYKSVLDVGCGNGRFLEEASKKGLDFTRYLGIDASLGMIGEAGKLHPESQFEVCAMESVSSLKLHDSSFDAILFLASFHHLENRESRIQVLENMKKLLAPNGRIYLTNWNLLEQERYIKNHRGNGDFDIKIGEFSRYYHGFTIDELYELFEQAELSVMKNHIFDGERNIISILTKI